MARRSRQSSEKIVGRPKAADPFELIRWLARSQSDPRKALAEGQTITEPKLERR